MVTATAYAGKAYAYASSSRVSQRVQTIETIGGGTTFTPLAQPTVIQELTFLFQATSFTKTRGVGDARVYVNGSANIVAEETEATVVAYGHFDDIGGNAVASTSPFTSGHIRVPLLDLEGRTAYYHGHATYLNWEPLHPEVSHTKQFMLSHAFEFNVPGTIANDQRSFVYYDTHANFNISTNVSLSLWFYPTDINEIQVGEDWRTILYRRIDASNHYAILLKPADGKIYVFVQEAGVTTKLVSTAAVTTNAWNLIMFTYNPTTNALVIYLNNSSASSTPGDTYTPPYTTDANLYIGGLPNSQAKRFTGYMDNFVMWSGKIVTISEASNMWNNGTLTADATKNIIRAFTENVAITESITKLAFPKHALAPLSAETITISEGVIIEAHQANKQRTISENIVRSDSVAIVVTYTSVAGNFTTANFITANFST